MVFSKIIKGLKMTKTYTIELLGWGNEVVLGTISNELYDFIEENDLDLEEFVFDTDYLKDNDLELPEGVQLPFEDISWEDCDNICHQYGIKLEEHSYIEVYDENRKNIFQTNLILSSLSDVGIETNKIDEIDAENQPIGTAVFFGFSDYKGIFGEYEITVDDNSQFDPTLLKINYGVYQGMTILKSIFYNGIELEMIGDEDVKHKNVEFDLIMVEEDDDDDDE